MILTHLPQLPGNLVRLHAQRLEVLAEQFDRDLGPDTRHQFIDAHGDRLGQAERDAGYLFHPLTDLLFNVGWAVSVSGNTAQRLGIKEPTVEQAGATCVPNAFYLGPAFLAVLHCLAAKERDSTLERMFADFGATPFSKTVPIINGGVEVPQGPGLGADPEDDLIAQFRV